MRSKGRGSAPTVPGPGAAWGWTSRMAASTRARNASGALRTSDSMKIGRRRGSGPFYRCGNAQRAFTARPYTGCMAQVLDAATLIATLTSDPDWKSRVVHVERYPARAATFAAMPLHPALLGLLKERGIDRLYSHQARAIEAIRGGVNCAI